MASKASIHLEWTGNGVISHRTSGVELPPPRDDKTAWLLAPSPSLLLAHQCGVLRPSVALITCARVMDMLLHSKYLLLPINSALKAARIDFIYTATSSVRVQFHPKYGRLAADDSVEEAVTALINNYTHYVYAQLDGHLRIVFRTMAVAVIRHFFNFFEDQIGLGKLGQGRDNRHPSYSVVSAKLIAGLSSEYYVPQGGRTPTNEKWAKDQTLYLDGERTILDEKRAWIFRTMGIY